MWLPKDGRDFGGFRARAECSAAGGLIVRAIRWRNNAPAKRADGTVVQWSDSRSLLLPEGIELCPSVPHVQPPITVTAEVTVAAASPVDFAERDPTNANCGKSTRVEPVASHRLCSVAGSTGRDRRRRAPSRRPPAAGNLRLSGCFENAGEKMECYFVCYN